MNKASSIWSALVCSLAATVACGAADLSGSYAFRQARIGGGGFVTGIVSHPKVADLLYCRTDVGGAYRLSPGSDTWEQIVTSRSMPAQYVVYGKHGGVDALAVSAAAPDVLYIAFRGTVFRSEDRGGHFMASDLAVAMNANDEGRMSERLAVDPLNAVVAYYGSRRDGLWRTIDGKAWKRMPDVPAGHENKGDGGVVRVLIDPSGGEIDGRSRTVCAFRSGSPERTGGVFRSTDGGKTWDDISRLEGRGPGGKAAMRDADLIPTGGFVCCADKAAWQFDGEAWRDISPPSPGQALADVAVDPFEAKRILLTAVNGEQRRSEDGGGTWTGRLTPKRRSPEIPWLEWTEETWFSTAEVIFDAHHRGRIWTAQGIGVWSSEDLAGKDSITWTARSKGIEEMVVTDLIVPPGGKPIGAVWDRVGFRFDAPDRYPADHVPANLSNGFSSGWSLACQAGNPKSIVLAAFRHNWWFGEGNHSGYSDDGGRTWTRFASIVDKTHPKELRFGNIAVARNNPSKIVWVPEAGKMPCYTADRGKTWRKSSISRDGKAVSTGGFNGGYFVVKRMLVADPGRDDTFLLYHWEHGLFRSTDGGKTFVLHSTQLPAWRWHPCLRAVDTKPGHFWFAGGLEDSGRCPLMRSTDGGATWAKVAGIDEASVIGLGKPAPGGDYPTIFVEGILSGRNGLYRSTDEGKTWDFLVDYPLGVFDKIVALCGDMDHFGRLYLGFSGNGFACGAPTAAAGVTP